MLHGVSRLITSEYFGLQSVKIVCVVSRSNPIRDLVLPRDNAVCGDVWSDSTCAHLHDPCVWS